VNSENAGPGGPAFFFVTFIAGFITYPKLAAIGGLVLVKIRWHENKVART
jgi:hypothetical protein